MVLGDERTQLTEAGGYFIEDAARTRGGDILIEPGDTQSRGSPERSRVGRNLAGHDPQQARFACAVPADQTDPFARLDTKVRVRKERQMSVGEGDVVKGQKWHVE
jgi:hypothetical protein